MFKRFRSGLNSTVVREFLFGMFMVITALFVAWHLTDCPTREEPFRLVMSAIYNLGGYGLIFNAVKEYKINLFAKEKES